jgi:DNA-binding protein HU-beta
MNKQALVELVHGKIGGTKVQAEMVVDSMFDEIVATLKRGDEVSVAGFGIFSVKARPARTARNPKTGASVQVPATRVPKFRAAKALKDAVAK